MRSNRYWWSDVSRTNAFSWFGKFGALLLIALLVFPALSPAAAEADAAAPAAAIALPKLDCIATTKAAAAQPCVDVNDLLATLKEFIRTDGLTQEVQDLLDSVTPIVQDCVDARILNSATSSASQRAAAQLDCDGLIGQVAPLVAQAVGEVQGAIAFIGDCTGSSINAQSATFAPAATRLNCDQVRAIANQVVETVVLTANELVAILTDCLGSQALRSSAGTTAAATPAVDCQGTIAQVMETVNKLVAKVGPIVADLIQFVGECTDGAVPLASRGSGAAAINFDCNQVWVLIAGALETVDWAVAEANECIDQVTGGPQAFVAARLGPDLSAERATMAAPAAAAAPASLECPAILDTILGIVADTQATVDECLGVIGTLPQSNGDPDPKIVALCSSLTQPVTVPVPTVCNQRDADGDQVPVASICMAQYTIDPVSGTITWGSNNEYFDFTTTLGDPDDGDNTMPIPKVGQAKTTVTPNCRGVLGKICYELGATVTFGGNVIVSPVKGETPGLNQDVQTPEYAGSVSLTPDGDGDGIPAALVIQYQYTVIKTSLQIQHVPTRETAIVLDDENGSGGPVRPIDTEVVDAIVSFAGNLVSTIQECKASGQADVITCAETACYSALSLAARQDICAAIEQLTPYPCFDASPTNVQRGESVQVDASCSRAYKDETLAATLPNQRQFRWDWDNDGEWDTDFGTSPMMSTTYSSSGYKDIALEVQNSAGFSDTIVHRIIVDNAPTACFSVHPAIGVVTETAYFDPTCSSDDLTLNSGLKAFWDFNGDGVTDDTTTAGRTVQHTYPSTGTYAVRLTVEDASGRSSTISQIFEVRGKIQVCFSSHSEAQPYFMSFDASCTTDPAGGYPLQYSWSYDGYAFIDYSTSAAYTRNVFDAEYHVMALRVRNSYGSIVTTSQGVAFAGVPGQPAPPSGPSVVARDVTNTFYTYSNGASSAEFNWGDGTSSAATFGNGQASASHKWVNVNTYDVKVRVTNGYGTSAWSDSFTVTVQMPNGIGNGPMSGPDKTRPYWDETYRWVLSDPEGDASRVVVSWGDGTTSTSSYTTPGASIQVVKHWSGPGDNCVTYHVEDIHGTSGPESTCFTVHVWREPIPCVNFFTLAGTLKVTADASCTSTDGPSSLTITWGDGTTPTTISPGSSFTHPYGSRGRFHVNVVSTDPLGSVERPYLTSYVGMTDPVLAQAWAPVLYHDTANDQPEYDEVMSFNFDGNWAGGDNWDNGSIGDHRGYVYYYVVETEGEYHIGYGFFHPRDRRLGGDTQHENDWEGILLLVAKNVTNSKGDLLAMHAMEHNYFDSYNAPGTSISGRDKGLEGMATIDGGRPQIEIQQQGHGAFDVSHDGIWDGSQFKDTGNIYKPTGVAENPGSGAGGIRGQDANVGYALQSLDDLWYLRDLTGSNTPYHAYGEFWGDKSGTCDGYDCWENEAHAPWGMFEWDSPPRRDDGAFSRYYTGLWFENPALFNDMRLSNTGGLSDTYYSHSEEFKMGRGWVFEQSSIHWLWRVPGATSLKAEISKIVFCCEDTTTSLEIRDGNGNVVQTLTAANNYWDRDHPLVTDTVTGDTIEVFLNRDSSVLAFATVEVTDFQVTR